MLLGRALRQTSLRCRPYSTQADLKPVPILPDLDLETFRNHAFLPATPALLPRKAFKALPAHRNWFAKSGDGSTLNHAYLARFGSTIVPLEISNDEQFTRIEQSLSFFLECVHAASSTYRPAPQRYFSAYVPNARAVHKTTESNDFFSAAPVTPPTAKFYLAQAPIADLPQALRDDVPAPELVRKAGKGDVYDSSIWLGQAPTYTPLHRDPNPNLFVQLAGRKVVRLFRPETGAAIFAAVQEQIGGRASATMRGEEMMQGEEKNALEKEVWGESRQTKATGWEAELGAGDGLFIPKGWWHSVKGMGSGMNGSVNWWFR
ncbi:Cupin-like domain [Teratosphaeria destructans]|uniref:Cupin-like domain n=1 Tax=Teratosphaeria destructans TaxID=418781 RepID=A0A9W7W1T0_9PEZI|nr:Cupin-like domain [Teratosphaeria destructans]